MAQLVYVSYYKKPLYTMAQATTYKDVLLHRRYMSYRMSPLGFEPRTHGLKGRCSTVELGTHNEPTL
jgi:hypothetical protein